MHWIVFRFDRCRGHCSNTCCAATAKLRWQLPNMNVLAHRLKGFQAEKWFNDPHPWGEGCWTKSPQSILFLVFRVIKIVATRISYHIWQMSLQRSCGDTCQMWMWCKESNNYFLVPGQRKVIIPCVCLISNHKWLTSRIPYFVFRRLIVDFKAHTMFVVSVNFHVKPDTCTRDW